MADIHRYFIGKARVVFAAAGGNPDNATALAEWAQAQRDTGLDTRRGVIVAQDGRLLAETSHIPARADSPGATYVTTVLPAAADVAGVVQDREVGLACGSLRRAIGQDVLHVTSSQVCTGAPTRKVEA